jgi:peptidylprolyl isomerase
MKTPCLLFFAIATAAFGDAESAKLSEALGHMIGKNLQSLDVPLDMARIAKGLQDEAAGVSSPMSEEKCIQTLIEFQKKRNLQQADSFLKENQKKEGVVALEAGLLQYEIVKKGNGQKVQSYNSPLVRLKREGERSCPATLDEVLSLDEAVPGLRLGIIGMQEGEIRKLYIHPNLAFENDSCDSQNGLLVIEVEVLDADASSGSHAASNPEISPLPDLEDVRHQTF